MVVATVAGPRSTSMPSLSLLAQVLLDTSNGPSLAVMPLLQCVTVFLVIAVIVVLVESPVETLMPRAMQPSTLQLSTVPRPTSRIPVPEQAATVSLDSVMPRRGHPAVARLAHRDQAAPFR
jgi:hypothetical protein